MSMAKKPARVSSEAALKATGKTWEQWLRTLDDARAQDWPHKQVVAYLGERHGLSPWWQQAVAVEYERARGTRVTGRSADVGYEIGVQITLPFPAERLWALLLSREGLRLWLGDLDVLPLHEGSVYQTRDGVRGDMRTVQPGYRLRLTWQPEDWSTPSTLQVTVVPRGEKAALHWHQERLSGEAQREAMRARWRRVTGALATLLEATGTPAYAAPCVKRAAS